MSDETDTDETFLPYHRLDRLLENEFGGFYLSAPHSDPMGEIRLIVRSGRAVESIRMRARERPKPPIKPTDTKGEP